MKNKDLSVKISKKDWKNKFFHWLKIILLIAPLLLTISIFLIYPLVDTFIKSLKYFPYKSNHTYYQTNFNNYDNVFNDPDFKYAILNSTMIFFIGSFISLFLAFLFALLIESLIFKITRNIILSLIYSQFFISSFAVGISFIFLFGPKNIFFQLIGFKNISFTNQNTNIPIWVYYSIFQIWRSLPFNLVLFSSAMNKANSKYFKQIKSDNLSIKDRIKFIYFNEISKIFFAILFTNFIYSALLFPEAILDLNTTNISSLKGHTLSSFIMDFIGKGNNSFYNPPKAYAASFIGLIYLIFLFLITFLLNPFTIKKIVVYFQKKRETKYVKNNIKRNI